MMMRMNDVVMTRIDGASVITVIRMTSCISRPAAVPVVVLPRSTVIDWAKAGCIRRNVIPAKAGIHIKPLAHWRAWVPAFAGMTDFLSPIVPNPALNHLLALIGEQQ